MQHVLQTRLATLEQGLAAANDEKQRLQHRADEAETEVRTLHTPAYIYIHIYIYTYTCTHIHVHSLLLFLVPLLCMVMLMLVVVVVVAVCQSYRRRVRCQRGQAW